MTTDPIADFLTRIRNASSAGLKMVEIPGSNIKRAMTQILFDQGYILNFKFEEFSIILILLSSISRSILFP